MYNGGGVSHIGSQHVGGRSSRIISTNSSATVWTADKHVSVMSLKPLWHIFYLFCTFGSGSDLIVLQALLTSFNSFNIKIAPVLRFAIQNINDANIIAATLTTVFQSNRWGAMSRS